ncbi:segregation and condensation protein A [Hydrocarboniclastica marina]|uniref:Segregation and condensation protein A n=1 Tax=Hydrocarboniclastica marina TaxID=2259620 RepID=A0A4P7XHH8_9ALTE|nr:segregation/condensation protein A [Hydrocarboniclastica marina]MAL98329.1 segregation/condensation protein A [Alteromonadaceae bacterium]QCF25904.1 segregation/condensation protein A [Hydrocarboniclastica marina]|tara:strand:+ start:3972 stop:4811 length:840 start_codon:yes stop_codon:yes gene_type:complete
MSHSEDEAQLSESGASDHEPVPRARVSGKPIQEWPKDLYIPPDALAVILEAFEGPLDLLLYLIRRQNMDILDVDVSEITKQYMDYIGLMEAMRFELAAEYLLMAATLAEIKSRMLLPRQHSEEEEELDPRAELIRRLQQYERFKKAAEDIDSLPRMDRDTFGARATVPDLPEQRVHPDVDLRDLLLAMREVMRRADMFEHHQVSRERLSTRERMSRILERLQGEGFVSFTALFTYEEGKLGVVVTFLATLELIKEQLVEIVQAEVFAPIHLRARIQSTE